jgi:hypothetical protein
MRFARGDMRDHIASHKNDQGASYRRYGVLPWRSRLKIHFCEIFGVVQFSTFATIVLSRLQLFPASCTNTHKRFTHQCFQAILVRRRSHAFAAARREYVAQT